LLVFFVGLIGSSAGDIVPLPSSEAALVGLVVVFLLSGLLTLVPRARAVWVDRVWPVLSGAGSGLLRAVTNPWKAAMIFGGAAMAVLGYVMALWFSLEAFGGGLGFAAVAVVFLAGEAVGQAAPTPGGVGATEAAMIAGMTALGLDASIAVPSVFLFRFVTFWLPVVPGLFALRTLKANGLL